MAKSCRGGFLGSHCQWVALQNQRYGMGMEEQGGRAAQRLHTRVLSISGSAAQGMGCEHCGAAAARQHNGRRGGICKGFKLLLWCRQRAARPPWGTQEGM